MYVVHLLIIVRCKYISKKHKKFLMIRQHSYNITREKKRETNINKTQNITYIETKAKALCKFSIMKSEDYLGNIS